MNAEGGIGRPAIRPIPPGFHPKALCVAISTGGPTALYQFLAGLPADFALPILITQHMPAGFTAMVAEHIARDLGRTAVEACQGAVVRPATTYVAPGGTHMTVVRKGREITIELSDRPPVCFCKPSANPMLMSATSVWAGEMVAVILTGLGRDGLDGARRVVEAGGVVGAQDRDSSVVWGMPKHVALEGLCSAILPPRDLGIWVGGFMATAIAARHE